MLSVEDAIARIAGAFSPLPEHQRVPLLDALGRVLVEDIPADVDMPRLRQHRHGRLRGARRRTWSGLRTSAR